MSGAAIIFMIFGMVFLWGGFTVAILTSNRRSKKFDY